MTRKILNGRKKITGKFLSITALVTTIAILTISTPVEAARRTYTPMQPSTDIRNILFVPETGLIDPANLFPQDEFYEKLSDFSGYDMNQDGINEIENLSLLSFEMKDITLKSNDKLVVVMVEPRLLNDVADSEFTKYDLIERLESYKNDLEADGYRARFVSADVYSGWQHQDGQTVLAMREFFKSIYNSYPNFQGAVLVGSFPEAMLVRQVMWKKTVGKKGDNIDGVKLEEGDEFLRISASIWADRSEIVLSDLDGRWDKLYQKEQLSYLKTIEAIPDASMGSSWPLNFQVIKCSNVDIYPRDYEDFFFIRENDYWVIDSDTDNYTMMVGTTRQNPEISEADKLLKNPVAQPEITVSRINPNRIAVNPDANYKDVMGNGFLDNNGIPQEIKSASLLNMEYMWKKDAALERKILIDFFDRNHAFRTGEYNDLPFRAAAIAYGSGLSVNQVYNEIKDASDDFEDPIKKSDATLLDYVEWLKKPAVLRGIIAHSSENKSNFGKQYDYNDLENAIGGNPWKWVKSGDTNIYQPTLSNQMGKANIYLNRTIWENGVLKDAGANFFVHAGCKTNSPFNAASQPYTSNNYGKSQNAESVLFYLNGLAMVSRAKIFNDVSKGFGEAFGAAETSCFGDGWSAYFKNDGNDESLGVNMLPRSKRSYCWSIIGDWTLRLRY